MIISKSIKLMVQDIEEYKLEYEVNSSPKMLYFFLSTPNGLSEWFCDDVKTMDNVYTFIWEGSEQKAELVNWKVNKQIRFKWLDQPENSFFEFKIELDEITKEVALIITDFAATEEHENEKLLWNTQVNLLMHRVGS